MLRRAECADVTQHIHSYCCCTLQNAAANSCITITQAFAQRAQHVLPRRAARALELQLQHLAVQSVVPWGA